MRESFTIANDAPDHTPQLARQVESAFDRVPVSDLQQQLASQAALIADLQSRVAALEAE